jgi:phosphoglycolate phosphatase
VAIRAVLFDLDGTLVQTREASWELFEETNRRFELGIDTRERFFELFQKNFFRSLADSCSDKERLARAKEHFLTALRTRYSPPLVPGMADVVRALAERFTLAVVSTNTIATIRRILTTAGLAECFAHVFAGDVEPDKSRSMRRFVADAGYRMGRRCSPAYDEGGASAFVPGDEIVLVTDTVGDIAEARAAGVRAIAVAWGMHAESELLEAGAERVALWPQELCAWILPESEETCAPGACACSTKAPPDAPAHSKALVLAAAQIRRERRLHAPARAPAPEPALANARAAPLDAQLLATLGRLRRPIAQPTERSMKGTRP